jgi:hypothetical protein
MVKVIEKLNQQETASISDELYLPLQRLSQDWGLHIELLLAAVDLIDKKTIFTARAWFRLLREAQDTDLDRTALIWQNRQKKALLLTIARSNCFSDVEQHLLLMILKQLELLPQISAA